MLKSVPTTLPKKYLKESFLFTIILRNKKA
jgi:hypothetical protein